MAGGLSGWPTLPGGALPCASPNRAPLASRRSVCYIRKVLVGARTPYLEPNPTTGTGETPGLRSAPGRVRQLKPNRVSQFQVPGRDRGTLGLEQPARKKGAALFGVFFF